MHLYRVRICWGKFNLAFHLPSAFVWTSSKKKNSGSGTFFVFHLEMMQPATYVAASSVAVDFMRLLFVLSITVNPVIFGYTPVTRRFILSAQGKNRCPDIWYSGPRRVLVLRSHLECARNCAIWSEYLHYDYKRNNGSCTLYSMTPDSFQPTEDCTFMLVSRLNNIIMIQQFE